MNIPWGEHHRMQVVCGNRCFFPAIAAFSGAAEMDTDMDIQRLPPGLRVLVADDSRASRKLLCATLERHCSATWAVREASSAEEAVALCKAEAFDLVMRRGFCARRHARHRGAHGHPQARGAAGRRATPGRDGLVLGQPTATARRCTDRALVLHLLAPLGRSAVVEALPRLHQRRHATPACGAAARALGRLAASTMLHAAAASDAIDAGRPAGRLCCERTRGVARRCSIPVPHLL